MEPQTVRGTSVDEEVELLDTHPSMFRESPLLFLLCVLLIAVFGLGLLVLLGWWIYTRGHELRVTNKRVILRRGLFSKHVNEVLHRDIRNIQIRQSFAQRLLNVGDIGISSSGQDEIEIFFKGLADPHGVKDVIDRHRPM